MHKRLFIFISFFTYLFMFSTSPIFATTTYCYEQDANQVQTILGKCVSSARGSCAAVGGTHINDTSGVCGTNFCCSFSGQACTSQAAACFSWARGACPAGYTYLDPNNTTQDCEVSGTINNEGQDLCCVALTSTPTNLPTDTPSPTLTSTPTPTSPASTSTPTPSNIPTATGTTSTSTLTPTPTIAGNVTFTPTDACSAASPITINFNTIGFDSSTTYLPTWVISPTNVIPIANTIQSGPQFTGTLNFSSISASGGDVSPGVHSIEILIDPVVNGTQINYSAQVTRTFTIDDPASAACSGATNTPTPPPTGISTSDTPTPTPTIGASGTVTPTNTITPSTTGTPQPTQTPTVTPNPGDTILGITLGLTGIGSTGDESNPSNASLSNQNPVPQKQTLVVHVEAIDAQNTDHTLNTNVSYNSQTGLYTGIADFTSQLSTGAYTIKVKIDGYLRKILASQMNITTGTTTTIPQGTLIAGDLNGDNAISIVDYGILNDCIIFGAGSSGCSQNQYQLSDLNGDGVVDITDYNLWIRNSKVTNGD